MRCQRPRLRCSLSVVWTEDWRGLVRLAIRTGVLAADVPWHIGMCQQTGALLADLFACAHEDLLVAAVHLLDVAVTLGI